MDAFKEGNPQLMVISDSVDASIKGFVVEKEEDKQKLLEQLKIEGIYP